MLHRRTLRFDYGKTIQVLYVLGSELNVNLNRFRREIQSFLLKSNKKVISLQRQVKQRSAPPSSKFFSVKCTADVQYTISPSPTEKHHLSPIPLDDKTVLSISMKKASEEENDNKLSVWYYDENKAKSGKALLHLTAVEISLDVDADRDGIVEKNNPNKGSWTWGPDGHGAVLLVNCDCERLRWKRPDYEQDFISKDSDLKDMTTMVLRTKGPTSLPEGYKLTMHISQGDSQSIRVYRAKYPGEQASKWRKYPMMLNARDLSEEVYYLGGETEMEFYVEGLRFPDKDFDGLVTINLSLLEPIGSGIPETPIFTDQVALRVAPWIMTPNILNPIEVYVCKTADNAQFLSGMRSIVAKSGDKLKICSEYLTRGDRWMQDELEFGYVEAPHHKFPVVLDSPRDRGLGDFPFHELLGPDFGYVTREAHRLDVSSLDSFGNLEVSPPVTVEGREYPLGRIIIGVAFPTAAKGRNMTQVIQDFLWAQKVQAPIALFSDWLIVGHIDEFMTFVPAHDRKGFRLLLASPDAAYKLFRRLQNEGHGQAQLFDGIKGEEPEPLDDVLGNEELQHENNYVQSCINWNRDVLKRELGLDDEDIIDLPILFKLMNDGTEKRAVAYYPDMVNMIVLGNNLGIPKPFGPKVNGRCALEAEMCSLLEPLGLQCSFLDDFVSYHKKLGEVHCGSNVRREPFNFKWWNLQM